jgi:predicted Zn-dependent protease
MAHFNNEAQFAGVLGHEIGHVTARHTVAQQSKQQLAQIGLIGGMILSPELASQGQNLMQGMQLLFLKFGRDAESQSDELGVKYSTAIGYDSKEMAGFFGTLDRLSGGSENRAPSFLSTHPDPLNRLERVRELTVAAQAADSRTEYEIDRNGYLRRIDGILYGEDPNQGYVENSAFYHPTLRFQFGIPSGWKLINSPTMVQMVSPDQNAIMQMRLAQGSDPRAAAQEFVQQNNIQVTSTSDQAINGLPATTVVGDIVQQAQQGQRAQTLRTITSFISYGGNIYMMAGLAMANNFNRYSRAMEGSITSFAELTDQSKLNRQPERVKIVTTDRAKSLQQALLDAGIPQTRLEEFSVLNGIELNTQLPAGYLYKAISGGTTGK